jgi:hypothetical protein
MVDFVKLRGVFEGLCHIAQTAFAEVPDTETGQIKALQRQQTFAGGFQ